MTARAALLVLAGCAIETHAGKPVTWVDADKTAGAPAAPSIADRYRDVAAKIVDYARKDRGAYTKLSYLTDRIGNRLAGSPALDRATQWGLDAMKADGHDAHLEPVMVPHWVRNAESGQILFPMRRPLPVLGLGGSVATPKGGIAASIVVVHDWAELEAKKDAVKGAIVVYDVAMPPYDPVAGSHYGETVEFRGQGAIRAAKLGAVAVLVRSVTAHSLHTLHTGAMRYDEAVPKIPAAAITVEDATLLSRLAQTGDVRVHLEMTAEMLPDVPSANVIGEIKGKDLPDEVVIIGGHIDSWDVGQGAHDDGAGCVTMMQALTTIRALKLSPRRTIRVVLYTNEENGVRGGKQYAKDHADELSKIVLAIESDSGGFSPQGFSIQKDSPNAEVVKRVAARMTDIASLLAPIDATKITVSHGGTDVGQLTGVVQAGLVVDGKTYFDIHHTNADTLDKVDPVVLARDVAAVATMAFIVADMPERLDK